MGNGNGRFHLLHPFRGQPCFVALNFLIQGVETGCIQRVEAVGVELNGASVGKDKGNVAIFVAQYAAQTVERGAYILQSH